MSPVLKSQKVSQTHNVAARNRLILGENFQTPATFFSARNFLSQTSFSRSNKVSCNLQPFPIIMSLPKTYQHLVPLTTAHPVQGAC